LSDRRLAVLVLVIVCLLVATMTFWFTWSSQPSSPASPSVVVVASTHCHSVDGLPDAVCTPGAIDARVTQDNIATTICISGYTKTVRPSSRYTHDLKVRQIREYGYEDTSLASYEEDHLISLELGGHPTDPKNLWPQPRAGAHPASRKDLVENSLHSKVCAGTMTLAAAQAAIATNWESVPQ
jgi:hypothetical protein